MEKHLLIQNELLITLTIIFAQYFSQSKKKLTMSLSHFKTIYQSHAMIHLSQLYVLKMKFLLLCQSLRITKPQVFTLSIRKF